MPINLSKDSLDGALRSLDRCLADRNTPEVELVVCGGAALIATDLLHRTTVDVDIVALRDRNGTLISPAPLPEHLSSAAEEIARTLQLPPNWLNNGPSSDSGGLFQMGLPKGFHERLHPRSYGSHLTVHFIDRVDQIHFKLYAAVDRGGYHISDLNALLPTEDELVMAATWAMTHDVSEGFRTLLQQLLRALGYDGAAARI